MLSERLRTLLNERGISIADYAEMCDIPLETVRNIYYGKSNDPKLSTALKMAQALNMSVNCLLGQCPHTSAERAIIQNYRSCSAHGRSLIELVARYEANAVKSARESSDKHRIPCLIPRGDIRAGIIYDNSEVEQIETSVKEAYVAIRMVSNDLVPVYCKGDDLLFENRFPKHGEYAAFYSGGKAYIRKFVEEDGGYRLKCLHSSGVDIVLKRMDEIEYIGTCVGVNRL